MISPLDPLSRLPPLPPGFGRSQDEVYILRLAWRCWWYGLLGLAPLLGFGLAVQTTGICRKALREMGLRWTAPRFWPYWILAVLLGCGYWAAFGLPGALFIYALTLAFQGWFLAKSFPPEAAAGVGGAFLRGGLLLGCIGRFTSIYGVSTGAFALVSLIQ